MEHVVFFPGPDGSPAFRRTSSLDDAVRFVEHLRNIEGVTEVSVHALSEVPLAFRAYYRVEMPHGAHAAEAQPVEAVVAQPAPVEPVEVPVQPVAFEPVAVEPEPVPFEQAVPFEAPVAFEAEPVPFEAPVAFEAAVPEAVEEPVAAPEEVAEPSPVAEATPFVTPAPAFGEMAPPVGDIVPAPSEQPALNGRRSLGFFSH